jgi:hypothetical protein
MLICPKSNEKLDDQFDSCWRCSPGGQACVEPEMSKHEGQPSEVGRGILLLVPSVIGVMTFILSPLFLVYTIIIAVYFMGGGRSVGRRVVAFFAVCLLLPLAYECCIVV